MTPNNDSSCIIYDAEARGGSRTLRVPFKIYNYAVIPSHFPLFPYHLWNRANLGGQSLYHNWHVQSTRNYLLSPAGRLFCVFYGTTGEQINSIAHNAVQIGIFV